MAEQHLQESASGIALLDTGRCGEVCSNEAAVMIDDLYVYCWPCLARLVRLGAIFDGAMAEAKR